MPVFSFRLVLAVFPTYRLSLYEVGKTVNQGDLPPPVGHGGHGESPATTK